jgi:hypothetical protein
MAVRDVPEPERSFCVRFNGALRQWLKRHPEVSAVFVSQISGGRGFIPAGGKSEESTAESGYIAGWTALPPSVKHVIVLRDTPKMLAGGRTLDCVARAVAAGRKSGIACAQPRSSALDVDPAVVAAHKANTPRVQVVDMTSHMCDKRKCFPVIGGALVYKDQSHMTTVFARTLAPFVAGQLEGVGLL